MHSPLPRRSRPGILVVDDTPATLQILTSILTEAGYHVRTATDGRQALSSTESQPPDLILLDIRLPDMDGFEVCRRLKADERTRSISVIFTTWLDEPRDKVHGFQLGAADYITKPFDNQEVLARISTHMAFRRTQQELQQANRRLMAEIAERERAEAACAISTKTWSSACRADSPGGRKQSRLRIEVAARQQTETALRESEAKFRTLVESAPLGVYLTDAQGRCQYVNRRWSGNGRALAGRSAR